MTRTLPSAEKCPEAVPPACPFRALSRGTQRSSGVSEGQIDENRQLVIMPLFYEASPLVVSNRIKNVHAAAPTWNAQEWDVS